MDLQLHFKPFRQHDILQPTKLKNEGVRAIYRSKLYCYMVLDIGIQSKGCFPNKKKARITAFIIDETLIQIGNNTDAWLWVAVEPIRHRILSFICQGIGIC